MLHAVHLGVSTDANQARLRLQTAAQCPASEQPLLAGSEWQIVCLSSTVELQRHEVSLDCPELFDVKVDMQTPVCVSTLVLIAFLKYTLSKKLLTMYLEKHPCQTHHDPPPPISDSTSSRGC